MLFASSPRWVVHPFLIVAAYVLNVALPNEVAPAGYIRALVVGLVLTTAMTLVGWATLRTRWDGALLASGIIIGIASPVPLAWLWFELRAAFGVAIGTLLLVGAVMAVLGGIGIRILQLRRRRLPVPRPAPESLNVLSIALVAVVVASNIGHLIPRSSTPVPPPAGWHSPVEDPADIVVILLDGYPRSDVLERRLGAQNAAFLDGLRQRGFDVATTNHSNYPVTELTLPSMLQMRYVDQVPSLIPLLGNGREESAALRDAAEAGQALSILHSAGYELIFSLPGWEHMALRTAGDRLLDSGEITDFERSLFHRTWILYLLDAAWPNVFADAQRDRVVHSLDAIDAFAAVQADGPRFLLLHVPAPHLPLVVQADGTPASLLASRFGKGDSAGFGMTASEYSAAWQSEVDYLDDRVLRGIDMLMASEAGQRSVIVVMSDHGYSFEERADDPQAQLGNLFAARTLDAPGLFANPPTPVNLFRVLFNGYLGTDFPPLPNRFFVRGEGAALSFPEVYDPDRHPP